MENLDNYIIWLIEEIKKKETKEKSFSEKSFDFLFSERPKKKINKENWFWNFEILSKLGWFSPAILEKIKGLEPEEMIKVGDEISKKILKIASSEDLEVIKKSYKEHDHKYKLSDFF